MPELGPAGPVHIERFSAGLEEQWDHFVREQARNGTIFHERRFLSYHEDRFQDCSLAAYDGKSGGLLAVCPAAFRLDNGRRGVVSHPGSTYGGVVFRDDLKTFELKEVLDAFIRYFAALGAECLTFILQEEFHTGRSFQELTYLLWHRGFSIVSKEASTVIDLQKVAEHYNFRRRTLQYVKSRKDSRLGLTHHLAVSQEEVAKAYAVLAMNLQERHGKKPTHSLDELLLLRSLYPDRIKVFYSLHMGEVAATVTIFELGTQVAHDFYISHNPAMASLKPLLGLFMHVFNHYRERGFQYVNLGISSRGKWIKSGILNFKEQFGGRLLTRDVWRLDDPAGDWPHDGAPA